MAGPTTESLDTDAKDLRKDLAAVQLALTKEIGEVKVSVEKLATKVNLAVGLLGSVAIASLGIAIAGIANGSFWAGSINNAVVELKSQQAKQEQAANLRFERLETSIAKILEQTKAPQSPKGE